MSQITIFDNSTGKFNNVDFFKTDSKFWINGYHFTTKNNNLKGKIQFFMHETTKRIHVSIHKLDGKQILDTQDCSYMTIDKAKHISIDEYDNFIMVKIYV